MKKILTIIFISFSVVFYSQQKYSGEVFYTISLKTKINSKKNIENSEIQDEAKQKAQSIIKNAIDVVAYLKFTEKESLYRLDESMENDAEKGINLTRIFAGKNEIYYLNNETKVNLLQKNNMIGQFLIIKQPIEWEITQESKQIGNYTCFKAIKKDTISKNKKIIAWFTPQIPVSFGPKEYNGLPGLILQVDNPVVIIKAVEIKLNPKKSVGIKEPTRGEKITEKEYKKLLEDYFPDFNRN